MKAMILAAGRGSRMSQDENAPPKPLMLLNDKSLIEHQITKLARAGFCEFVINVSHQAPLIKKALGHGEKWGIDIAYSEETIRLGTGGGIKNALPLLGDNPFVVVSGDLFTDFPYTHLKNVLQKNLLGHLILSPNPSHHLEGDYGLTEKGLVCHEQKPFYNFAGIYVLHPLLFKDAQDTIFPITDLFIPAMKDEKLSGELYEGLWMNVDTPERLALAKTKLCVES
jgi:N-acetyl-alpha-D-muramate 1-phosphate uridylyltransferase